MQDTDILTEAERILDEDEPTADDIDASDWLLPPSAEIEQLAKDALDYMKSITSLSVSIPASRAVRGERTNDLIMQEMASKTALARIKRNRPEALVVARQIAESETKLVKQSREAILKGQQ